MTDENGLRPIQHEKLAALPGIRHGFFTREGGVSTGIYQGLNVGVGSDDEGDAVEENRRRVASWFGVSDPVSTVRQIHSADIHVIDRPLPIDERPQCDALVTATRQVPIGVLAADCGPLLFGDAEAGVVAAAHAGWQGAFKGVAESTIRAMEGLGAERRNIVAVLGPSIRQDNYEVGPEFVERFVMADGDNRRWFRPSPSGGGHAQFDLAGYTLDRLRQMGVSAHAVDACTYADEDHFFSYRRTTHRSEPDYGRQISAIMLS